MESTDFKTTNLDDALDLSMDEVASQEGTATTETGASDPSFYRPSLTHKKLKAGNPYKAFGRFVLNINNKMLTRYSKYVYYLQDSESSRENGGFYIDDPSGGGKSSKNIVTTAFFFCKDHDSKMIKDIGKRWFSRKLMYWSPFMVYTDDVDAEMNGKLKIIRYGDQIFKMQERLLSEDPKIGKKAVKIFNPFGGRDFQLVINEKIIEGNKKITNYDDSQFLDNSSDIMIEDRRMDPVNDKQFVANYLKENTPSMEKILWKAWSSEDEEKVIASVKASLGDQMVFDKIYRKAYGASSSSFAAPTKQGEKKAADVSELASKVTGETKNETAPAPTTAAVTSGPAAVSAPAQAEKAPVTASEPAKSEASDVKHEFNDLDTYDFDNLDT